ncbi:hypothetical protein GCM10022240_27630 [Microbacterium kribbense]|uniref:DUF4395 domain-containing protein n=1 Tax=Microbacterium kribbense TaxID=433645 RepID=A0ABP7GTX8_9MICO
MPQEAVYQPGVCNIGPAEIRRRRQGGCIGLVVSVLYLAVAFALGWSAPWRLLVVLPAMLGASGFLQGAFHFCVNFGSRGLYNFGARGTQESVHEAEFRRKDQRTAVLIGLLSLAIAVVVALMAFFIPVG